MQVYFIYAPEDESFVVQLSNDLRENGFKVSLNPSDNMLENAVSTDAILTPLSESSTTNPVFVAQLEPVSKSPAQVIVLRTSTIREVPEALKGILPLDFSSKDGYADALQTLIEDLEPPTVKIEYVSVLPRNIETLINSSNPDDRLLAIQHISNGRAQFTDEQLELAERLLRDLVFKDNNSNVKQVARVTLQLLGTPPAPPPAIAEVPPPDEQDTLEIVTATSPPAIELPDDATPIIIRAADGRVAKTQLLVFSQQWWLLPIAGAVLALSNAIYQETALGAVPTGLVWLVLPWFNVLIRDGGRFDWKLPGPIVGNGIVGTILSLIGTIIVAALGAANGLDVVAFLVSGTIYGVLIGWMSAFHLPPTN